jgi:hypothetical protein
LSAYKNFHGQSAISSPRVLRPVFLKHFPALPTVRAPIPRHRNFRHPFLPDEPAQPPHELPGHGQSRGRQTSSTRPSREPPGTSPSHACAKSGPLPQYSFPHPLLMHKGSMHKGSDTLCKNHLTFRLVPPRCPSTCALPADDSRRRNSPPLREKPDPILSASSEICIKCHSLCTVLPGQSVVMDGEAKFPYAASGRTTPMVRIVRSRDGISALPACGAIHQAKTPRTTRVPDLVMLVRRCAAPWEGKVSFSWSNPSKCIIVACRSCTETRSLTAS